MAYITAPVLDVPQFNDYSGSCGESKILPFEAFAAQLAIETSRWLFSQYLPAQL